MTRRKSLPARRTVAIVAVSLAVSAALEAAVFATGDEWANLEGPAVADTNPDAPPPLVTTGLELSLPEAETSSSSTHTSPSPEVSLQDVIDQRISAGQRDVNDQLAGRSAATGESVASLRETTSVIVSLQNPIPYDLFEQRVQGKDYLPSNISFVTSYLETSSGYPFTFTDKPGAHPRVRLRAMAATLDAPEPAGPAGDKTQILRSEFREALETPDSRWLVLGFSFPFSHYSEQEDAIDAHFGIAAAEIDANPSLPAFKPTVRSVTSKWLGDLRGLYGEGQ